jgi:fermentation-respiration switch protein FrsA (DUF1100 family)
MKRQRIRFASGDTSCTAWHYPGANGGCVIMTGGFAVTKEPGTDLFARRFNGAGFGVLAFDYRNIGESGGQPRQVQRVREQLADWQAAIDCARALDPDRRYPDWRQEVAARSALRLVFYRPGRYTARVRCPLLVLVCDRDQSVLAAPGVRAASRAPRGELVRLPGGHYEPFLGGHERAVEAELSFLRRHLLGESPASRPGATAESAGRLT